MAGASGSDLDVARRLALLGPRVVVKAGADGGWSVASDGHPVHADGLAIEVVDTTGAGDSFDAGYLAALAHGVDDEAERLRWATVAGSLSTLGSGGTGRQATLEDLRAAMITAVAVSPSLDVTYVVDELAGIQRPLSVHRVAGGKALNAARAAALLGSTVTAVAVLGGGTGAVVAQAARTDGLDLRVVDGDELTRTCVSIHSRSTGALTEIYEHATDVSRAAYDELLAVLSDLLAARPGWCLVSGGFPASLGDDALVELVDAATGAGARVAVDSHGPVLRALLAHGSRPTLVKVNRAEACEVLDQPVTSSLETVTAELQSRTGGLVVVTDGLAGMLATDGRATLHAALPGVVGQFPVGSGDSALGALVHALDAGHGLDDALRLAVATGCANALVPGAARFDPATVRRLAADVVVR